MKKSIIQFFALVISAGAFMSFKEKEGTSYGGSASVRINVVQITKSYTGEVKERKTLSSPTLNATTECVYSSSAKAKDELKRDLEMQAYGKVSNVTTAKAFTTYDYEFDGSIDYRINSCN